MTCQWSSEDEGKTLEHPTGREKERERERERENQTRFKVLPQAYLPVVSLCQTPDVLDQSEP